MTRLAREVLKKIVKEEPKHTSSNIKLKEIPEGVKPPDKDRKKYDLNMKNTPESDRDRLNRMYAEGNEREKILYNDILQKIEVKTDYRWKKTGNVAIEIQCNGKPSGLAATESTHWAIELAIKLPDGTTKLHTRLFESVESLKEKIKGTQILPGGDRKASLMHLVPLTKFIKVD